MSKKIITILLTLIIMFTFAFTGCSTPETLTDNTPETTSYTVTYTVTITKLDCTEMYSKAGKVVDFYASVVSDDYVNVIEITAEQYAQFNIGDVVTVNTKDDGTRHGLVQIEEFNEDNKFLRAFN